MHHWQKRICALKSSWYEYFLGWKHMHFYIICIIVRSMERQWDNRSFIKPTENQINLCNCIQHEISFDLVSCEILYHNCSGILSSIRLVLPENTRKRWHTGWVTYRIFAVQFNIDSSGTASGLCMMAYDFIFPTPLDEVVKSIWVFHKQNNWNNWNSELEIISYKWRSILYY